MQPDRWARMQSLFHTALTVPPEERIDHLRSECPDDPALVADVMAMLEQDARDGSLLDRDLGIVARAVMKDAGPAPARIGPYRVIGIAGRGGMGSVYLAERDDLGSRAAIKVLRDATLSPARRHRFATEQRLLAQLDHPFIARLYDADALPDGTPYFVMEYVEGEAVTTYAAARRLTLRERLELFRDVCQGVQYAHSAAVIHRDLKPSNILVRTDGVVKLLDFGIAKQLEGLEDTADYTLTSLRMMTPAYAAPEQVTGGRIGTYTDVYSLGVILYELLTGRLPFEASAMTPRQLETAIVEQEPVRPSRALGDAAPPDAPQLGRSAWADLDVLCRTAMHREPDRRYGTVTDLLRDVGHYLAREPLEARGDGPGYRLDRFLRRNARPVAAAALAVLALTVMGGYYAGNLAAARDDAILESARAHLTREFLLDLFRGGDPELGPTDSVRVVSVLARGLAEARMLDGQPRLQADLYATLGGIYHQLGDLARADSLLTLALEQRRSLHGEAHPDVAASLVALGRLRADQAEFHEAEDLVREGLATIRRAQPPRPREEADAIAALGEVLREKGEHPAAIAVLEEAVALHGPEPTPPLANVLAALAGSHFYAGNYSISDSLSRRVLDLQLALNGPRHPHVADALINLGAVQFEQGRYGEAESMYRQALGIKLGSFGEENHQIAANRTMLGRALVAQERYDEGLSELEPALRIRQNVFGPDHPAVASTLNEIGTVRLAAGDLDGAEAAYGRMLQIYEIVFGDTHAFRGIALSNLANVAVERGDLDLAEDLLSRALQQFIDASGPEHSNAAIARIKLGRVIRQQERWPEAIEQLETGFRVLSAQAAPGSRFLQAARTDLAEIYEALGDPERAAHWRTGPEPSDPADPTPAE
jgi:eukaryotic-like serine/threonine-protein kinase